MAGRARAGARGGGCTSRQSRTDDAAGGADAVSESDPQSAGTTRGVADAPGRPVSRAARDDARLGGRAAATGVQARVLDTWRLLQAVETERHRVRRTERQQVPATATTARTPAQWLARLRGIAARSATVLADELFSRDLHNRREVGALTGLVSAPYRSGTIARDQGIAPSGLPAVRRVAVEIAWAWLRYQPTSALSQWYHQRFGGGGAVTRRIGIVALARRVIIALWRYVETGVVPAGALLKA